MSSTIETLIAKLLNDLNLFSNDYITVAELKTVEIDGLIKTIVTIR